MNALDIENVNKTLIKNMLPNHPMVLVGLGTCGIGNGADKLFTVFKEKADNSRPRFTVKRTGCFGFCAHEPLVMLYKPGNSLLVYSKVDSTDVDGMIDYLQNNTFYSKKIFCRIDHWDHITGQVKYGNTHVEIPHWDATSFFKGQKKIVLRNAGFIDPENIDDYIAIGGYQALTKALTQMDSKLIIDEVINAKLRGRGGAGFPTGTKWAIMQRAVGDKKYIICNADEGDPGAYMNRNEIESDPHMLIEGMIIGAYAMGANEGIA
jgi:NADH-quinone oxidoreductase subunit F